MSLLFEISSGYCILNLNDFHKGIETMVPCYHNNGLDFIDIEIM